MTKITSAFACGVLLTWAVCSPAQSHEGAKSGIGDTVQRRTFVSGAMGRELPYTLVLPHGYADGHKRYPVLYLLHGWNGDETNWVKLTHLVEDAASYPLIIVMPRADNSWYVNSSTDKADRYGDYVANDLLAYVDAHFRTIATPNQRAIAGLSMGGYGALLLTLTHTGMFGFAASISGAFDGPTGIESVLPQLRPSTDAAFGPSGSAARKENNLATLIENARPGTVPFLFLECGESDPLLTSNRRIVAELSARNLSYEYRELPGAHTWTFWDGSLTPMLRLVSKHLAFGADDEVAKKGVKSDGKKIEQ